MQKIDFRKEKIPFTQVANEVLNDPNLSFKAKGLYAYLYSKPDGWNYAIDRIAKDSTEGRKAVNAGLQELETQGYLLRLRQKTGRVDYLLKSQMPKMDMWLEKPNVHFGKVPKWQSAEMGTVSNKEGGVIKSISNKETSEQGSLGKKTTYNPLGAEVIKEFEAIDGKNKTYYGNKTQRAACDFLIGEYGLEEVKNRIKWLAKTNTMPYFPVITTPCQLRDKWKQLEGAMVRHQDNQTVLL